MKVEKLPNYLDDKFAKQELNYEMEQNKDFYYIVSISGFIFGILDSLSLL